MQQNFKQFFMKNAVLICSVALGAALTIALFINHFLISREKTKTTWR